MTLTDPAVRSDMVTMVEEGVFTYLAEYTNGLFPDIRDPAAQDCIAEGVANALRRYQAHVNMPILHGIINNLND